MLTECTCCAFIRALSDQNARLREHNRKLEQQLFSSNHEMAETKEQLVAAQAAADEARAKVAELQQELAERKEVGHTAAYLLVFVSIPLGVSAEPRFLPHDSCI